MVSFVPQPVELVDYIPLNYYACMAQTSPVTQGIIVEMFKDKGIACILRDRLTISSDDKVEQADSDRCYGIVANEDFILVCEYGCNGSDPEIVLYKRR